VANAVLKAMAVRALFIADGTRFHASPARTEKHSAVAPAAHGWAAHLADHHTAASVPPAAAGARTSPPRLVNRARASTYTS
jgi:hypothetical protein